jgi:hypothetical protein
MPAKDDVIVRPADDSAGRFILGTLQAPRQFVCLSYDEAIAQARTYAKTSKVRVWHTDDDRTFTLVSTSAMAKASNTRRRLPTAS